MVCYGMVWYGMVVYGMLWYGTVGYGMVWYGTVRYGMVCMYGRTYVYNIIWRYTVYKCIPFYILPTLYRPQPTHGVIWLIHHDSLSNTWYHSGHHSLQTSRIDPVAVFFSMSWVLGMMICFQELPISAISFATWLPWNCYKATFSRTPTAAFTRTREPPTAMPWAALAEPLWTTTGTCTMRLGMTRCWQPRRLAWSEWGISGVSFLGIEGSVANDWWMNCEWWLMMVMNC